MNANHAAAGGLAEVSRRPLHAETLLSIVLPVYNEAAALPILSARIAQAMTHCDGQYEVVFVDDGSTDAGGWILDRLADSNPRIRVVHLSRNFGHQAAVQAGLAHARGDAVILMDSDMQDAPEAIPRMVERWRAGFDVVYAVRTRRKESAVKRLLFAAFHRILARVASIPIPAEAGVFGLIDRRVADEIRAMAEADRYFPGLRCWVGFRQTGIEVERNARYDARPRVSWTGLFRLAKTAVFSFSTLPLRAFYVIGVSATVLFLVLSVFALVCKLGTGMAIPGWTSQLLVASFFGALNALGICMLGEYVVRIYAQVRGRPLYVVRDVYCAPQEADSTPSPAGAPRHAGSARRGAAADNAPADTAPVDTATAGNPIADSPTADSPTADTDAAQAGRDSTDGELRDDGTEGAPQRDRAAAEPALVPSAPTDWPGSAQRAASPWWPLGSEAAGEPGSLALPGPLVERLSGAGSSASSASSAALSTSSTEQLWDEVQASFRAL